MVTQLYAEGNKERFHRGTPIGRIFQHCHKHWADVKAGEVFALSESNQALLLVPLGGCVSEQVDFLCAIYDEMYPDEEMRLACRVLVYRQRLLDVINWRDDKHRERVVLVYLGVKEGRRS